MVCIFFDRLDNGIMSNLKKASVDCLLTGLDVYFTDRWNKRKYNDSVTLNFI